MPPKPKDKVVDGRKLDQEANFAYSLDRRADWRRVSQEVKYDLDRDEWFHEIIERDTKGQPVRVARHIRYAGWIDEVWVRA
jgi:hypothetical protein